MNNLPRNATALEKRTSNFVRPPHHISNYSMHYLSAKALRERERGESARAHTHKVGAKIARTESERKVPRPVAVARQKQRAHFVFSHSLHSATSRKSLARKGKVARPSLSLFRAAAYNFCWCASANRSLSSAC
jgi:predicted type IV restriction endonuclease